VRGETGYFLWVIQHYSERLCRYFHGFPTQFVSNWLLSQFNRQHRVGHHTNWSIPPRIQWR